MSQYPDPQDPRVQEDIREAVRRARDSALGSFMSEQDIANSAAGYLGPSWASAPGIAEEIRYEVHRGPDAGWTVHDHRGTEVEQRPPSEPTELVPVASAANTDPVRDLTVDHWCTDAEIHAMSGYFPYEAALMESRFDPTCPAEFYRGYVTALVGLAQSVGVHDTIERYRAVVTHIDEVIRTWTGVPDQGAGAGFAMTNAWQYSESGASMPQMHAFLQGEIACIAECFRRADANGP